MGFLKSGVAAIVISGVLLTAQPARAEPITIALGTAVIWGIKFMAGKAVVGGVAAAATTKGTAIAISAGAARGAVISLARSHGVKILSKEGIKKAAQGGLTGGLRTTGKLYNQVQ